MPYLYRQQVNEIKTAHRVNMTDVNGRHMEKCTDEIIRALRKLPQKVSSPTLLDLIQKKVTEFELAKHRREGHVNFLKECPECREGRAKRRPHRRQQPHERPGGELSLDLSGPHWPARWPSDAAELWPKRPQYFMIGVFNTYTDT